MRAPRGARAAAALAASVALAGCAESASRDDVDRSARDFDDEGCAACGMIVREQPAPRGQVIHRDGTRAFLCSIDDMLTYLAAPSPHGAAVATYVEALAPGADPAERATAARPWVEAERAGYVVGVERERIMGVPVMVYASRAGAERAAATTGGRAVAWSELRAAVRAESERRDPRREE